MQQSAQRVGVFVDVQNMYYSARALFEQKVDFGQILKEAVGDRHLIRAFAYVIAAENEDEGSFFNALQDRGYELRTKQLLNFYGGNSKGDWDVGIAMDVVKLVPKLDVVVLVSGDGDFAELLRYVKSRGVRAEVMAFGSSASSQLREEADALLDLSQDTKRFLIPKKTQPITKKARTLEGQALLTVAEGMGTGSSTHARTDSPSKQQQSNQKTQPAPKSEGTSGRPFELPKSLQRSGRSSGRRQHRVRSSQQGGQQKPSSTGGAANAVTPSPAPKPKA
jgi:uncharacterized LabA/DUF88 family protein